MYDCPDDLKQAFDAFVADCEAVVDAHPALVVTLMHEFFRNMYPHDPHIPFAPGAHALDRCRDVLENNRAILGRFRAVGSYLHDAGAGAAAGQPEEVKQRTGKVYGMLWNEYTRAMDMVREAATIITERFAANDIPLDMIRGARVLDAGCGSGRYACALALLGAAEVVGLDYGDDGLELGRRLAADNGLDNVRFDKGSLLDKPYPDESFDFVWANGVYHHTEDMERGTREFHRVMRTGGGGWYYIYGQGGLYWYARAVMNRFMKRIPQEYAVRTLSHIGMPRNRFIFCDNWYVPLERHTSAQYIEPFLRELGFSEVRRADMGGRVTDFDHLARHGSDKDRDMWGEGQLRYMVRK